ncbi:MAG TPA: hypothetical protein VF178_13085 [Gemmatimonadaceae bacterium]
MRPPALAVVGPGETATDADLRHAESLGALAAAEGWTLLTGGIASGVMDAANRGARAAGGLTVGILPTADTRPASPHLSVAIVTAMGQARNNVIVLSSDAVAVCGMSAGTAVEAALALRAHRPLVFVAADATTRAFYERLGQPGAMHFTTSPEEAIAVLRGILARRTK